MKKTHIYSPEMVLTMCGKFSIAPFMDIKYDAQDVLAYTNDPMRSPINWGTDVCKSCIKSFLASL